MLPWRSKTEDEAMVESTVIAEIFLINHWCLNRSLNDTTIIFVKCDSKTLFDMSKNYNIKISGDITRENKEIIYHQKKLNK